jgi:enoyl-CoA hydratase
MRIYSVNCRPKELRAVTSPTPTTEDVIIRRDGRAGRITLNRPKALNALTWAMTKTITAALIAWRNDPTVECIILDGAGDRGLCAGGDVRWLYDIRQTPSGLHDAAQFWREEYILDAMIARYPKPFVAIMDGIVMGGGIGLSAHARHRIVTERSNIAMPETTIGLIPDVGGSRLLAHAQGRLGVYLGLTGARMDASDAIQAGFADTYVPLANLPTLIATLTKEPAPDEAIEAASVPVPPSKLAAKRDLIDRLFHADSVGEIQSNLLTTTDELAKRAHADLATRSPKALALALESILRARKAKTLEECLTVEYRLCNRLYEDGEFIEGVRALIVDKDKAPKWNPPRVEDVTPTMIEGYFAPLPAGQDLTW